MLLLTKRKNETACLARCDRKKNVWELIKAFWPDGVLFVDLLVLFLLVGVACIYEEWPEGDPWEHIHASYLVSLGEIPYRDFFEHHHGLLWYITAPIVNFMARNTAVYEVLNYLTFLVFSSGLYFVYRTIRDFMGGRSAGLIALVFILVPNIFVYYVYFKPDNWMFPLISGGIYYYFKYLSEKKRRALVFSYMLFFLAFAMCQKALFYFPVIGISTIWLLYKQEMNGRDFAMALLLPVVFSLGILGYFYYQDALREYFLLNFKFNGGMIKLFGEGRVSTPDGWFLWIIYTGVFVSLVCYKFENRYFRLYSWIFLCLFLQKKFYFSPHIYYWYEAYYFAVPLVASAVIKLMGKKKVLLYLVVLEIQFYVFYMANGLYSSYALRAKSSSPVGDQISFVVYHTTPCDEVVSFKPSIGPFNKYPMYYWFLLGHVDVFGEKLGFHKVEDLNKIIEKRLPKVIYLSDVKERYAENIQNPPIIHKPDLEMIEKYYYPSVLASDEGELDFETLENKKYDYPQGIWLLKEKWRKKNCVFDEESNRWRYADEN